MKSVRRLLAIALVIVVGLSSFVLPGYAVYIYKDKTETYSAEDELSTNDNKIHEKFDCDWDEMDWAYKNGEPTGGTRTSVGTYPTRPGVILVTSSASPVGLELVGHCAIVYSASQIIEAVGDGVVLRNNDWNTGCYRKIDPAGSKEFVAVAVRNSTALQDEVVAEWCKGNVGKALNVEETDTSIRRRYYSSQLIWDAFRSNYSIDLNTPAYDKDNYTIIDGNVTNAKLTVIGPYEFVPDNDRYTNNTYVIYAQNWWGK